MILQVDTNISRALKVDIKLSIFLLLCVIILLHFLHFFAISGKSQTKQKLNEPEHFPINVMK